jgi:carboxyl-terminal processing protease
MKKIYYLVIVCSALYLASCKKDKPEEINKPPLEGTAFDKIKDSVFLYAKEVYLWNDALPSYAQFNPRGFTGSSELSILQKELDALSQYKINPLTGKPYEFDADNPGEAKYSFIDNGETSDVLAGNAGDFGFGIRYHSVNDLRVRYVYKDSPAAKKSIRRGDQITSINGRTNLVGSLQSNIDFINVAMAGKNLAVTLKRQDGTSYDVNITRGFYSFNPVLKDTVISVSGKKIGYLVFNTFTDPDNATVYLDRAFERFTAQAITDLVVDLRYNGGGYVTTAEYLTNLIVPPAKNGSLMYNTHYNSTLTSGKAEILKNQWRINPENGKPYNYGQLDFSLAGNATSFSKIGSLNINRVFFIVTGATASSSELTINNLLPVMNVQLVGSTTYGKPVGFFDIKIGKYELYIPEFETRNSAGKGGYFNGMTPGSAQYPGFAAADDVTKEFGDPKEKLFGSVINFINRGSYTAFSELTRTATTSKTLSTEEPVSAEEQNEIDARLNTRDFKGMIKENPRK